ncbi:hypothetical protein ASZ78_000948 [Callipepla squamata]|uniref:E3 ubiquitin-protein ligase n=1 Tax=Callipepla squamata TaxID=9009 RepID=A0A226MXI3_CALSU|nr:hypothetical protein ASZ78_000948 [Callipepla squamata]
MGSLLSRRIAGVEDIDIQANSAYRYPPKSAPHEPVKTLRSLVNIRKDSLRLVRYKDDVDSPTEENGKQKVLYSLEFTFDADARVAITIYCQATEEFVGGMAVYSTKNPSLQSETVHYKRGVSQQFSLPSFKIDFSDWKDDELNFDLDRGVFPVVIRAVVDEGDVVVEVTGHAHVLLAAFEKHVDGSYSVKPLKQKQIVDRVSYLLQEIYGIENKNNQETKCPFKPPKVNTVTLPSRKPKRKTSSDNIPPGYEPISLLEALNGLRSVSPSIPSAPLYDEINYSGMVDGMPPANRPHVGMDRAVESSHQKGKRSKSPDSTLRSPSSPIHEEDEEKLSEDSDSQPALGGGELVLRETSSPESMAGEEIEDTPSLQQGVCLPSVEDVLQDGGCGEHRSLTQLDTDPQVDVYLPGNGCTAGA